MRQQLDDLSADKEELLRAYHKEQARLEDKIDGMRQANKVSTILVKCLGKHCLVFL